MKTKVLVSAVLSTIATAAVAQAPDYGYVPPPTQEGTVPSLFASEQGAYGGVESLIKVVESWAVNRGGCAYQGGPKKFPVTIITDSGGNGTAHLGYVPGLDLRIAHLSNSPSRGNIYQVVGGGPVNGSTAADFQAEYSYNIGSTIMASNVLTWTLQSGIRPPDKFDGTVIKDYWRAPYTTKDDELVDSVYDWGLQYISKKGYPYWKFWQASRTWRHDGIDAETHFLKTRIAPTRGCEIAVDLTGKAGIDEFSQTGYLTVYGPAVFPTKR